MWQRAPRNPARVRRWRSASATSGRTVAMPRANGPKFAHRFLGTRVVEFVPVRLHDDDARQSKLGLHVAVSRNGRIRQRERPGRVRSKARIVDVHVTVTGARWRLQSRLFCGDHGATLATRCGCLDRRIATLRSGRTVPTDRLESGGSDYLSPPAVPTAETCARTCASCRAREIRGARPSCCSTTSRDCRTHRR